MARQTNWPKIGALAAMTSALVAVLTYAGYTHLPGSASSATPRPSPSSFSPEPSFSLSPQPSFSPSPVPSPSFTCSGGEVVGAAADCPLPSPTAPSLSPAEQALADSLNSSALDNCVAVPAEEGGAVIAAVSCHTVQPGPTVQPIVTRFSNLAAAQAWFNGYSGNVTDFDDCPDGHMRENWTYPDGDAGLFACGFTVNGGFEIAWVLDAGLTSVITEGTSGPVMYSWWLNNKCVLSSGC